MAGYTSAWEKAFNKNHNLMAFDTPLGATTLFYLYLDKIRDSRKSVPPWSKGIRLEICVDSPLVRNHPGEP